MHSNYNNLYIPISLNNRDLHIENIEKKFKPGTIITPDHIKSRIVQGSSIGVFAKFVDCKVVLIQHYMYYWIKVIVNHQEWQDRDAYEERYKKCIHFRDYYNPMTGKLQDEPWRGQENKKDKIYLL